MDNLTANDRKAAEELKRQHDLKNADIMPCPFCGGKASIRKVDIPFAYGWVGCRKCHCFIEWIKTGKEIAINARNTRYSPN